METLAVSHLVVGILKCLEQGEEMMTFSAKKMEAVKKKEKERELNSV